MGGRGISCVKCKKITDRYTDNIKCVECEETLHIECANFSVEGFRKIVESKENKHWKCENCVNITSKAKDGNNEKGEKLLNEIAPVNLPEESSIPTDFIMQENVFLRREIALLNLLVEEMRDKNKLLEEKLRVTYKNKVEEPQKIMENVKLSFHNDVERRKTIIAAPQRVETVAAGHQSKPGTPPRKDKAPVNIGQRSYVDVVANGVNTQKPADAGKGKENPNGTPDEMGFKTVRYGKRRQETIVGTGTVDQSSEFKAAEKNVWVYVGGVNANVTKDIIINYVKQKTHLEHIECDELNTIGKNKSFKVGLLSKFQEQVYDPGFWPCGTLIRRFNLFRGKGDHEQQQWSSN